MKTKLIFTIVLVLFAAYMTNAFGQCPMCRMSAESNLQNGGTAGRGLNNGILYMLAVPYLAVGLLSFIWIKNRRRSEDEIIEFD